MQLAGHTLTDSDTVTLSVDLLIGPVTGPEMN